MQQRNILSRLDEHLSLFKADSNWRQIWEYIKEHPGSNNTDISVNTWVSDSTNWLIMHLNRNWFIETEKEWLWKNREHSFTDRWLAYQEFHDKYHQQIRAINHDIRREIVEYLSDENSVKNVNSICENVWLRQSVASQQLKILLDAWLVHNKRNASDARMIIYSIDTANLTSFSNELEEFLKWQTDSE
jgi:DNA-binding transcriptional ArsR family regulator